jgi:hypothetical protein
MSHFQASQQEADTALWAYSHADVLVDLIMIISQLNMHHPADYPPLFQVAFNYHVGNLLNRDLGCY